MFALNRLADFDEQGQIILFFFPLLASIEAQKQYRGNVSKFDVGQWVKNKVKKLMRSENSCLLKKGKRICGKSLAELSIGPED